jgi:predicted transglutaminase-like cysteine proteinase
MVAGSVLVLLGAFSPRPTGADEIRTDTGGVVRQLEQADFHVASASTETMVLSLLDPGKMRIDLAALPPRDAEPTLSAPMSRTEPFGLRTLRAPRGALWTKWENVEADIRAEAPALAHCRVNIRRCSPAARHFVAIVKQATLLQGRARLELINREINATIAYTTDAAQWNRSDVWSAPLDRRNTGSFDTGRGDCEDYAIAKYVALREAGVPEDEVQLVLVRDVSAQIDHAVLAVRQDDKWLLLDNRWSRLIEENDASFFNPLFALSADGVKRFTTGAVEASVEPHKSGPPRRRPGPAGQA